MIEMSHEELKGIQKQLKKTILEHQVTLSKLQSDPKSQELKKVLHELQGVIKTLSEEQKIVVQKYREQIGRIDKLSPLAENKKEDKKLDNGVITNNEINNGNDSIDNDTDNNENNSENIKSENVKSEPRSIAPPRPALIIPQLGSNAITKQNVPINAQTIKMPALAIKSITGQTHFLVPVATATKKQLFVVPKKNVYNYLKPIVKLPLSSSATSSPTSSSSSSQSSTTPPTAAQQVVHSTSLLLRTHNNTKSTSKVPVVKSLSTNRSSLKLTDKQMKDHFMMALGLVTKEALTELQSRKCERKRRTTANPQFSNAALEAKRITKLEIAERKAKRRLLITSNGENNVASNTNGIVSTDNITSNTNSNNNVTAKSNGVSNGKSTKSIGIEPQEISPGVHIVSSIGNLPANCNVCDEQCECDIDSILFCKYCRILFHATCSASKAEICKNAPIPCPKCEKVKKQTEEMIAKKREEKEKLSSKKKELDEKIANLRLLLSNLKESLKEKEIEKKNLIATQDATQQKVNKFIETLKLVEETSQWEDRFAAALAATDPKKRDANDDTESGGNSMEAQSAMESMDAETEKATAQLEQLVKAEAESHSLEMDADMSEIYQLQCHENAVEMYDIFVEDVQESVIVTDGSHHVGFFDTESQVTHESQHIHSECAEFNSDDRHVVLY